MSVTNFIVAIDGPAGSGKSTIAKRTAERLKLPYIDTGAMYRALTVLAIQAKLPWNNERQLARLAGTARIDLEKAPDGSVRVMANGEDVTQAIRTPALTREVHHVASCGGCREKMVALQRRIGHQKGGVLEGRDIGTVVFPKADVKVYLDGVFEIRAERRHKELLEKGGSDTLEAVKRDLRRRDRKDFTRRVAPLKTYGRISRRSILRLRSGSAILRKSRSHFWNASLEPAATKMTLSLMRSAVAARR